jgi:hypothetical protein
VPTVVVASLVVLGIALVMSATSATSYSQHHAVEETMSEDEGCPPIKTSYKMSKSSKIGGVVNSS